MKFPVFLGLLTAAAECLARDLPLCGQMFYVSGSRLKLGVAAPAV